MTDDKQDEQPSIFGNAKITPKQTMFYDEESLITAYEITSGAVATWFDRKDVFEANGNDFKIVITKFGSARPSGGIREGGRLRFDPKDARAAEKRIIEYFHNEAWQREFKDRQGRLTQVIFPEGWIYRTDEGPAWDIDPSLRGPL